MNRRHRSAQLAGRASVQLHTLIFFSGASNTEEDAFVLDVEANYEYLRYVIVRNAGSHSQIHGSRSGTFLFVQMAFLGIRNGRMPIRTEKVSE